jgi:hypothetical protein
MIEFTEQEKKLINDIFSNFPIQGNKAAVKALAEQMDIILNKINKIEEKK